MAKKNIKQVSEFTHGECKNVVPDMSNLSVHEKKPILGTCPHQKFKILLSCPACEKFSKKLDKWFIFRNFTYHLLV